MDANSHQHDNIDNTQHHQHHANFITTQQGIQLGSSSSNNGVPLVDNTLFYFPKDESSPPGQVTGRKKLWQCVYPGCTEPPKTHYNCFSHVWDSHIRRTLAPDNPLSNLTYKRITDRTIVKELCRQYIIELADETKRRGKSSQNTFNQTQYIQQQQQQQLQPAMSQLLQIAPVTSTSTNDTTNNVNNINYKSYSLDYDGITNITISPEGLARLSVCGEVFAEHGFLQRSDIRFKEDIRPIGGALERVLQITGKTFRYKHEAGAPTRMGFIAQELETVVPDAVHRDEHGLSVDIVCLVPLLLEALKEVYSETQRVQSERASALNDALKDAMKKTQVLNEKLDSYRSSSDSEVSSYYSDSSEENTSKPKHKTKIKTNINSDTKYIKKKRVEMKSINRNANEEELFAGGNITSKRSYNHSDGGRGEEREYEGNKNTLNRSSKRHFHYEFSFGPPIVVFVFCILFFFCGILILSFLRNFIFAWSYSFFVCFVLGLSLLFQAKEIKSEIENSEIKVFWREENSLNAYFLAVVGIFGMICTLILGTPSILCIGIYAFSIFLTGVLSIVFHRKYRMRVQSILVMSFGVLIFFTFCFIFVSMAQPYKSGFKGLKGPRIDIPVSVGEKIDPIHLKNLPWNCFSPQIELSKPLPEGVILNKTKNPPTIEGVITSSFTNVPTSVFLMCNGYQRLECGTLVFKQCASYTTKYLCKSNSCSWCVMDNSTTEGICGFCNNNTFSKLCMANTGKHPSTC